MTSTAVAAQRNSTITCPTGFIVGGLACGIKPSGADDLALILCHNGASAAAVFTRNCVRGAPITLSQQNLAATSGRARAVIINSGCANAATGEEGKKRAQNVITAAAAQIGCPADQVLANSTGVIGVQLPDHLILAALPKLVASCGPDGLHRAATAIMTTDTKLKITQQTVHHNGKTSRVVGIAKGAGMIHPNMATMIAVILTDALISPPALDTILRNAVEHSFHRITVDGDTSTNDSVFLLASGAAGDFPAPAISAAVNTVARDLALMIVRDGEGATRLIHVRVTGAATTSAALQVAQTVASSLLVRTSIAGGDPNWGRILAAVGRSGINIEPDQVTLKANDLPLYANGRPAETPRRLLAAAYTADEVVLDIDLAQGDAAEEFYTCDLTEQYVRVNAEYTS